MGSSLERDLRAALFHLKAKWTGGSFKNCCGPAGGEVSAVLSGHGGAVQDVGVLGHGGLCVGKLDRGQPLQAHWDGRGNQDSPLADSDQPPGVEGREENTGPKAFGTRQKQGTHVLVLGGLFVCQPWRCRRGHGGRDWASVCSARVGGSSDEAGGEAVPVRAGVQGRAQAHRVILTPALRSALPP